MLFATLTSESLTRSLGPDSSLFDGAVLSATDGDGLLLARYPENPALIGKPMPETALAWLMLGAQASGTAELPGPDGVRRLYTYTKVPSPGAGTLYMTVGIPSQVAYAQADAELRWGLASFGVVLLLALAAAWFGGELFAHPRHPPPVPRGPTHGPRRTHRPHRHGRRRRRTPPVGPRL